MRGEMAQARALALRVLSEWRQWVVGLIDRYWDDAIYLRFCRACEAAGISVERCIAMTKRGHQAGARLREVKLRAYWRRNEAEGVALWQWRTSRSRSTDA